MKNMIVVKVVESDEDLKGVLCDDVVGEWSVLFQQVLDRAT